MQYQIIKDREPFSGIALIIAGIAAVLSFLFPLIKLL